MLAHQSDGYLGSQTTQRSWIGADIDEMPGPAIGQLRLQSSISARPTERVNGDRFVLGLTSATSRRQLPEMADLLMMPRK